MCVLFSLDSQVVMTSEWRSDSKNMDGSWQIEGKLERMRGRKYKEGRQRERKTRLKE